MNKCEYKYTRDHLELCHRDDGRLLVSLTPHGVAINGGIRNAVPNFDGSCVWLYYANIIAVCASVPVTVRDEETQAWRWMPSGGGNEKSKPLMLFEPGWTLDNDAELMDESEYLDWCEGRTKK